ncbi:MAG: division/cell wall cluster transcriptional repressor MraZ [Elusimicrobia bacterium]|nr:division/cell wall cluster transcriptional repressor MraZ [Elusimicrobiota bacterium]
MRPFIGQYPYILDPKNRLFVPPKYREELSEEKKDYFVLNSGMEGCLNLFLPSQWNRFLDGNSEVFRTANKEEERAFKRKFFAEAIEVPVDVQGRILVPPLLKDYAGLRKDVYVIGVGNRAEVWDKGRWEFYYRKRIQPSMKKFSKNLEI